MLPKRSPHMGHVIFLWHRHVPWSMCWFHWCLGCFQLSYFHMHTSAHSHTTHSVIILGLMCLLCTAAVPLLEQLLAVIRLTVINCVGNCFHCAGSDLWSPEAQPTNRVATATQALNSRSTVSQRTGPKPLPCPLQHPSEEHSLPTFAEQDLAVAW